MDVSEKAAIHSRKMGLIINKRASRIMRVHDYIPGLACYTARRCCNSARRPYCGTSPSVKGNLEPPRLTQRHVRPPNQNGGRSCWITRLGILRRSFGTKPKEAISRIGSRVSAIGGAVWQTG